MRRSTLLDDLGTMLDPAEPGPAERVGHDLRRAIHVATSTRPAAPHPRRGGRRRLVAVAGFAVALTVTVLAIQTVRIAGRPPASTASAAEILHQAALAAEREPELVARPDQFVFTEWTAYVPLDPPQTRHLQRWQSADGTRDGLFRWRLETGPPRWHSEAQPASGQPAYRTDLPTDPERMLRYLYEQRPRICDSNGACAPYDPSRADQTAFLAAGELLMTYIPPRTRAALFQATARIPGMSVVQDVVDAAGRHGIAVRESVGPSWTELLFDPDTFRFLGTRISFGDQAANSATQRVAIVDRPGQPP